MSSRRSPGTRGGSATRWAVDPAAAPGGRSTPPESRKASSRPAGSGSEFNEESPVSTKKNPRPPVMRAVQ
jgi:hypothetical protein